MNAPLCDETFRAKIKALFSWIAYFIPKPSCDAELWDSLLNPLKFRDNCWSIDDTVSHALVSGKIYRLLLIAYDAKFSCPAKTYPQSTRQTFLEFCKIYSHSFEPETFGVDTSFNLVEKALTLGITHFSPRKIYFRSVLSLCALR